MVGCPAIQPTPRPTSERSSPTDAIHGTSGKQHRVIFDFPSRASRDYTDAGRVLLFISQNHNEQIDGVLRYNQRSVLDRVFDRELQFAKLFAQHD